MDKVKRLMEASCWKRLTVGETGSYSDGLMGRAVFPPCCLMADQTILEVMKIMSTSFKRPHDTLSEEMWVSLLRGHGLFLPGPVCTRVCLCPPRDCFRVLCKFCNQIPLASTVRFPGGSQSLCRIPRLGNLLWVLALS